jgi:capsular polysaccharide biosynthesis protein
MTEAGEPMKIVAAVRRQWVIVLVAGLIGLVAAGLLARSETVDSSKATQQVTVVALPGGIPGLSKAEVFVTAATSPTVLRAAEEKLDLPRGTLTGTVSTKLVTADKGNVSITVTAPSRAEAVRRVKAVSEQAVEYALAPFERYLDVQSASIKFNEKRAKELKADIARLEVAAASAPPAERSGYYLAIVEAKKQRADAMELALQARQDAEAIAASVYVEPEPRVSSSSLGGFQIATMIRGFLLGIVAGVIVALLREWLRGRRAAA